MSILEIILSFITVIFGGMNVMQLVTIKQIKRQAKTEVEKGNIDLATSSVNEMLNSVTGLLKQNRELVQQILSEQDEKQILGKKVVELSNKADTRSAENEQLQKKVDVLTKKVEKMQRAIGDLIPYLEKLKIDDKLIKALRNEL